MRTLVSAGTADAEAPAARPEDRARWAEIAQASLRLHAALVAVGLEQWDD